MVSAFSSHGAVTICVIYRPPSTDFANFLEEFTEPGGIIKRTIHHTLNAHLVSLANRDKCKFLFELLHLHPHVQNATSIEGHNLDLIIKSKDNQLFLGKATIGVDIHTNKHRT